MRSGRALYIGVSSYNSLRTLKAISILKDLGTPCLLHQTSYSLINKWVERDGFEDILIEFVVGIIAFSPLGQGMLTDKYIDGDVSMGSRAAQGKLLNNNILSDSALRKIRTLNHIATSREQSLAQMAIA